MKEELCEEMVEVGTMSDVEVLDLEEDVLRVIR